MGEKDLRAVLVGCGGISRAWLGPALRYPGLDIVGLVDLQVARAEARREEFGLEDVWLGRDLQSAIAATGANLVFDCTVPAAHPEVTLTALDHGCHVLGEKPMALSMREARAMTTAAEAAGRRYAVMQNRRFQTGIARLRAFLASDRIGPLTQVHADYFMGVHLEDGAWREMAHVLLLDMAIHTFDQARFLTGIEPVSVSAHEWNPPGSWFRRDASAVAVFELEGGPVFSYRGSWCAEGLATSWESSWRLVGSRGTVLWDGGNDVRAEVVVGGEGFVREAAPVEVPEVPPLVREGHAGVIYDFLDALRDGTTPATVCSDNIRSLAMAHAAIESARRRRWVAVRP